jgi:hypothetical protein
MVARLVVVALAVINSVLGLAAAIRRRAGPVLRTVQMAKEREAPAGPERATRAMTGPAKVRLDQLVLMPDRYCHHDLRQLNDPAGPHDRPHHGADG